MEKKPRAWSKYAKDSSAYKELHPKEEVIEKEKSDKAKRKEKKRLKIQKQKEVDALLAKYKDDPKFQEFLRVNQRNATEAWNNDAILEVGKNYQEDEQEEVATEDLEENKEALKEGLSDLDYLKSKGLKEDVSENAKQKHLGKEKKLFFTIKLEGLPYATKKKDIKAFIGSNMGVKSIRVPRNIKGIAFVGFATEDQRYDFLSIFSVYFQF